MKNRLKKISFWFVSFVNWSIDGSFCFDLRWFEWNLILDSYFYSKRSSFNPSFFVFVFIIIIIIFLDFWNFCYILGFFCCILLMESNCRNPSVIKSTWNLVVIIAAAVDVNCKACALSSAASAAADWRARWSLDDGDSVTLLCARD